MNPGFRFLLMLLTAGATALTPARAAPPEEGALAAAQAWARAIITRDVDAQMKLLPATMYPKPGDRERLRMQRLHDNELAVIDKRAYLSFDVGAPAQTLKVDHTIVVVLPYRSVQASADGKLQTDSSLIALAQEGSGQWSVFDGGGHGERSLKTLIPGYKTGLLVPRAASKVLRGE
jgi:hypothetical protein